MEVCIMKSTLFVEHYGRQINDKAMIDAAKAIWTGAGNKVKDIRSLDLYAKPEEHRIYFVINGEFTSDFEF